MHTDNSNYEELHEQTELSPIEQAAKNLLAENPDDFEALDDFISEHEDEHPDLADFVFRLAIQTGNTLYVDEHADDFDLNDEGGYSSYLYETDDEEMQDLLMDHGAFRSWEDYDDCRFAMESVNGTILAFDKTFQKEVFEKYKESFGLTNEKIREILETGEDDDESDRDVITDMEALGVTFEADEISFENLTDSLGGDTMDLLEELGWACDFEGDSWKLETCGVYFIK